MSGSDWDKSDPDEEPAVGYGRPPKHARFQKGQSGNPSGRPKKSDGADAKQPSLEDAFRAEMTKTVTYKRNGEEVEGTTFDVMVSQLAAMAMQGDLKAMKFVLAYAEKFKLEASPEDPRKRELADEITKHVMDAINENTRYRRTIWLYEKHFGEIPHHARMGHPWTPENELVEIRTRLKEGARQTLAQLGWDDPDEAKEEEDF
ncbi:DUF5681 domain-containing protein [Cucumibacter marinus]|uniref:DUF5681 domain-containing protein n=1 Tax=Cucumibacter marinus TaxID=1121252 RepID=UPI00041A3732|nr:DUF5681 domain-containing protein [Cucumibacter marinus]